MQLECLESGCGHKAFNDSQTADGRPRDSQRTSKSNQTGNQQPTDSRGTAEGQPLNRISLSTTTGVQKNPWINGSMDQWINCVFIRRSWINVNVNVRVRSIGTRCKLKRCRTQLALNIWNHSIRGGLLAGITHFQCPLTDIWGGILAGILLFQAASWRSKLVPADDQHYSQGATDDQHYTQGAKDISETLSLAQ